MTDTSYPLPPPTGRVLPQIGRSKGTKLLVVCVLAVLMSIPAVFVFMLLHDRVNRAEQVTTQIGGLMGGPQTFLGPVISVPYVIPAATATAADGTTTHTAPVTGNLIVFPVTGTATVGSRSEIRSRGLFHVPVYKADLAFAAHFDLTHVPVPASGTILDWSHAKLVSGASDSRGAGHDITAQIGSDAITLAPDADTTGTIDGDSRALDLFSAPVANLDPAKPFDVTLDMSFNGARSLGVLAFAKSTQVSMSGDWNWPSFDGNFLPATRAFHHTRDNPMVKGEDELKSGFRAAWSIPFIARGLPAAIDEDKLSTLGKANMSVTFADPANPYQSVGRSLKYALLFVGLVFLTYFLFESTAKKELHPAQYILIGLAQVTFYLLLLSLAEQIGFDFAFAVAATATVLLISAYAWMVFRSALRFFAALGAFSLLYALIYVLMRMEDYALLIGAISAFVVIAVVMILTRNLNWYGRPVEAPTN